MRVQYASPVPHWKEQALRKARETKAKVEHYWQPDKNILERAKQKRDLTGSFIEKLLSPEECHITGSSSQALVDSIREGEFSAEQVTRAFYKRAAIAHQLVRTTYEHHMRSRLIYLRIIVSMRLSLTKR
jgi:amidase